MKICIAIMLMFSLSQAQNDLFAAFTGNLDPDIVKEFAESQNENIESLLTLFFPSSPVASNSMTNEPSLGESSAPIAFPTNTYPSSSPSLVKSYHPSVSPSILSSTYPTNEASSQPSYLRSSSYWNYDPDSRYGPHNWERAEGDPIFKAMTGSSSNRCNSSSKQSPILLEENSACKDDHQIHNQRGNYDFDTVVFEVLPHALRAIFPKDKGSGKRAPRADFSNLSQFVPAAYMDLKIPSEHMIKHNDGTIESYPGEIQISHDWGSKIVVISFFVDFKDDEHNELFEDFIRKWEDIYLRREHECNHNKGAYKSIFQKRSNEEMITLWGDDEDWPGSSDFDLYRLMPTVYYYGYEGSMTTPPCNQKVHWRVQDLPMKISHDQYVRIRNIILDQKDEKCKNVSKAYNGGVNRPIQKTTEKVWRCRHNHWKVKYPRKWCGKWPEHYHGTYRIAEHCSE